MCLFCFLRQVTIITKAAIEQQNVAITPLDNVDGEIAERLRQQRGNLVSTGQAKMVSLEMSLKTFEQGHDTGPQGVHRAGQRQREEIPVLLIFVETDGQKRVSPSLLSPTSNISIGCRPDRLKE